MEGPQEFSHGQTVGIPVLLHCLDEPLDLGAVRLPNIRSRSFGRLVHLTFSCSEPERAQEALLWTATQLMLRLTAHEKPTVKACLGAMVRAGAIGGAHQFLLVHPHRVVGGLPKI